MKIENKDSIERGTAFLERLLEELPPVFDKNSRVSVIYGRDVKELLPAKVYDLQYFGIIRSDAYLPNFVDTIRPFIWGEVGLARRILKDLSYRVYPPNTVGELISEILPDSSQSADVARCIEYMLSLSSQNFFDALNRVRRGRAIPATFVRALSSAERFSVHPVTFAIPATTMTISKYIYCWWLMLNQQSRMVLYFEERPYGHGWMPGIGAVKAYAAERHYIGGSRLVDIGIELTGGSAATVSTALKMWSQSRQLSASDLYTATEGSHFLEQLIEVGEDSLVGDDVAESYMLVPSQINAPAIFEGREDVIDIAHIPPESDASVRVRASVFEQLGYFASDIVSEGAYLNSAPALGLRIKRIEELVQAILDEGEDIGNIIQIGMEAQYIVSIVSKLSNVISPESAAPIGALAAQVLAACSQFQEWREFVERASGPRQMAKEERELYLGIIQYFSKQEDVTDGARDALEAVKQSIDNSGSTSAAEDLAIESVGQNVMAAAVGASVGSRDKGPFHQQIREAVSEEGTSVIARFIISFGPKLLNSTLGEKIPWLRAVLNMMGFG